MSNRPGVPMDWERMSDTAREAAFDNVQACPDHAERWATQLAASAAFRESRQALLDLPYGPRPRNCWDLFPATSATAPCIAFIHGGYWQKNDRRDFASIAEGLVSKGWAAAFLGYTLAPQASLRVIVEEVKRALDWLALRRGAYGVAGPILLAGWSAGATLALLHLDHPIVSAGLYISGIYEIAPLKDTRINDALSLTSEEIACYSPLRVQTADKPLAVAYGEHELPALIANSVAMHARLVEEGRSTKLLRLGDQDHFGTLDILRNPDSVLVAESAKLLQLSRDRAGF
jgi:arylformamidase